MKELNHFVLGRELFASVKGHLFFRKRQSDNLEKFLPPS